MSAVEPQCGVIVGTSRRPCILPSGHRGEYHRDALGATAAVHDATERERRAHGQHLQRMREFRVGIPDDRPRPVTIMLDEFDALLAIAAERDALAREVCAMPDDDEDRGPRAVTSFDDDIERHSHSLYEAVENLRTGLLKRLMSSRVRRMFPAGTTADLRYVLDVAERSIPS